MRARAIRGGGLVAMLAIAAGCGGGATASWNPPFSGRRAYIVVSDARSTTVESTGESFTMVFDADQRIAILGGNRAGTTVPLQAAANGGFRFANPVTIPRATVQCGDSDSIRYDDLEFKIDAAGTVTGSGSGQISLVRNDVVTTGAATISLEGGPDTQGPIVGLYTTALSGSDAYTPYVFASSEPLPPDALPVTRAANGDVITLKPLPGDVFNVAFVPAVLLPFEQSYTIDITNMVDFAGNRATMDGQLFFSSGSTPLLVPADGFESQTDMLVSGTGAQFLSGPENYPIISGTRSLFVPPQLTIGIYAVTDFALRLAIAPGATVLRFSYRTISVATTPAAPSEYLVGSVGSPLVKTQLPPDSEPPMPIQIGGQDLLIGSLTTATVNLPDPGAGEVVFARVQRPDICHPLRGPAGVMIDDLRTE